MVKGLPNKQSAYRTIDIDTKKNVFALVLELFWKSAACHFNSHVEHEVYNMSSTHQFMQRVNQIQWKNKSTEQAM